jgi:hypothetical protein
MSGPMEAVDGFFEEPIENVTADITSPDVAGIYDLCIYGTDEPRNAGEESCIMLIVYDPSAGFVTGGGWITSPPGACYPPSCDPNAAGHANFGFVSKYKKGDLQPKGSTQFVFEAGGLIFHSTEYLLLVVNLEGTLAEFIGVGTVNGLAARNGGPFKFMIRAGDGGLGALIPDTFSIKIWWEDSDGEHVVYDYGKMQPIAGGSIVIHTKAQRANSQEIDRYRFEPHTPADTK